MAWYNDLSETQKQVAQIAQSTYDPASQDDSLLDSIMASWDLGKMDYNASGGKGWLNRVLGGTSLVNPLVMAGTVYGNYKRNEEANPNNSVGQNLLNATQGDINKGVTTFKSTLADAAKDDKGHWYDGLLNLGQATIGGFAASGGYGGQALNGTLQGTAITTQGVKSLMLQTAANADYMRELASGKNDTATLAKNTGKAWDLKQTHEIGIGDSIFNAVGSQSFAANAWLDRKETGGDSVEMAARQKAREDQMKEWGLNFMGSPSYDIYDKDLTDKTVGWQSDNGWKWLVQPTNFVGEMATDLSSYIPFGAVGKGSRLLNSAARKTADAEELIKASTSQASKYDSTLDALAKESSEGVIRNNNVIRQMPAEKANIMANLIARANTKEDVADLFLASNHGSTKALDNYIARHGLDSEEAGLIDTALKPQDYATRIEDGLTPSALAEKEAGVTTNQAWNASRDKHLLTLSDNPTYKKFLDITFDRSAEGNLVRTPGFNDYRLTRDMNIFGAKVNVAGAAERYGARLRADVFRDGEGNTWIKRLDSKFPRVYQVVRSAGLSGGKGHINLDTPAQIDYDKIPGLIGQVDRLTKNAATSKGYGTQLINDFRAATDGTARRAALVAFQKESIKDIARTHGLDEEQVLKAADDLTKKQGNFYEQIKGSPAGAATLPGREGGTVQDLTFASEQANYFINLNYNALNNALKKEFGSQFERAAAHAVWGADEFNTRLMRVFSSTMLFTPRRVFRDTLQNMFGPTTSPYATDFASTFFTDTIPTVGKILKGKAFRAVDAVQPFSKVNANSLRTLAFEQDALAARARVWLKDVSGRNIANFADKLGTSNEPFVRQAAEELNIAQSAEQYYHTFTNGTPTELIGDRWMSSTSSRTEAQFYDDLKNGSPIRFKMEEQLSDPKVVEHLNKLTRQKTQLESIESRLADYRVLRNEAFGNTQAAEQLGKVSAALTEKRAKLVDLESRGAAGGVSLRNEIAQLERQEADLTMQTSTGISLNDVNKQFTSLSDARKNLLQEMQDVRNRIKHDTGRTSDGIEADIDNNLKALKDAEANGKVIQYRNGDSLRWKSTSYHDIRNKGVGIYGKAYRSVDKEYLNRSVAQQFVAYGSKLDLREVANVPEELATRLGLKNSREVYQYIKSGKAASDKRLLDWADKNGYGKIVVNDRLAAETGETTLLNPRFVAHGKNDPISNLANENVRNARDVLSRLEAQGRAAADFKTVNPTKEFVRSQQQAQASLNKLFERDIVNEDYNSVSGLVEQVAKLAAESEHNARQLFTLAGVKEAKEKGIVTVENYGKGFTKQGQYGKYSVPGLYDGRDGKYVFNDISSARAQQYLRYENMADRSQSNLMARRQAVEPTDPQYFPGVSNYINRTMYNEPLMQMLALGKNRQDLVEWLTKNVDGKAYAESQKVGSTYRTLKAFEEARDASDFPQLGEYSSVEDYVDRTIGTYSKYITNPELENAFKTALQDGRNEIVSPQDLRAIWLSDGTQLEDLPTLLASDVFKSEAQGQAHNWMTKLSNAFSTANSYLAEKPQDVLFNHPFANTVYKKTVADRLAALETQKGGKLSTDEINAITQNAKKDAIKETQTWLYNVRDRTVLEEAASKIFPFVTAFTFNAKLLAKAATDNPAQLYWTLAQGNRLFSQFNWVDQNGQQVDQSQATGIAIYVDPAIAKQLSKIPGLEGFENTKEIDLSKKSLMSNFPIAGTVPSPGPVVGVIASEAVKANPALSEKIDEVTSNGDGTGVISGWLLPVGPSNTPGSIGVMTPTWFNLHQQQVSKSPQWRQTAAEVAIFENAQYQLGKRDSVPSAKEITDETNELYKMKLDSTLFSPVAFSVKTESDLAVRKYQSYFDKYPANEATSRFLAENPDLFYATVSKYKDDYKLKGSGLGVKENLDKYKDLVNYATAQGSGKDVVGFLVTPPGSEYDANTRNYLTSNSPTGDSNNPYVGYLSPQEANEEVQKQYAQALYNQYMGKLEAEAQERGTTVNDDDELKQQKSVIIGTLDKKYPAWAKAFNSKDPQRFNSREDVLRKAYSNDEWIKQNDRPGTRALYYYMNMRDDLAAELNARKATGGSGDISAKSNADLYYTYASTVASLKSESTEFITLYNQYFDNDTIV